MESDDESPQLKGVVIITLPPQNNPSLGKTITAFTLSNSQPTPQESPQQQQQLPLSFQSDPEMNFSLRRSLLSSPRILLGLVSISLIALIFWASSSPQTRFELSSSNNDNHDDNDDDEKSKPTSFLFHLYPKLGVQEFSKRDVELKLGKFVNFNSRHAVVPLDERLKLSKGASVSAAASTVLPVKGDTSPNGLYYTYILVGNPPRPYFLDMDTGSDLTWIQCDAPCTSCAKGAHPFYKPTKGNILPVKDSICVEVQKNHNSGYCETCHQCDYEIEYADHSSSIGVLARDGLQLTAENGSSINPNIVFGCAYDQQGLLLSSLTKTDGILGLSRAKVSLPSQLANQGIINNVIGHCLTTGAGGGGYMFLGDYFVPQGHITWVPMLKEESTNSYLTGVQRMTYGNKPLRLDAWRKGHGKIVFDSGSSYTYFTELAYADLVANLEGVSNKGLIRDMSDKTLPICWRYRSSIRSVKDVRQFFKPLNIEFARKWWIVSTNLLIHPEGYLIINEKGNVCLGILDGSKVHDGTNIILGDISLQGQLVVYDNVNQKVGWTQSDCVKPWRSKTQPAF